MRLLQPLLVLAALAGLTTLAARGASRASAAEGPELSDLSWMAGHWASEANGTRTEEFWLAPGGGLMLAINRTTPKGGRAEFEYLRIEQRKNELVYVASPGGKGATEFPLADIGEGFVLFENPKHDFPKTIRYELKDGALHARVAGDEGHGMEWTWKKQ